MIDDLNGFELNVLKLIRCMAKMKRGWTAEQKIYINLLDTILFPEEDLDD